MLKVSKLLFSCKQKMRSEQHISNLNKNRHWRLTLKVKESAGKKQPRIAA
jgi:hypothetical protein